MQAEPGGGAFRTTDNPVGCGKGPNDVLALHIFERRLMTYRICADRLISLRRWLQFVQRWTQQFAGRENYRPLNDVLQFTDIARPRVA